MNIRPTIIGAIIGDLLGSYYLKKDASSIDFRNLPDNLKPSLDTLIITEIVSFTLLICDINTFAQDYEKLP